MRIDEPKIPDNFPDWELVQNYWLCDIQNLNLTQRPAWTFKMNQLMRGSGFSQSRILRAVADAFENGMYVEVRYMPCGGDCGTSVRSGPLSSRAKVEEYCRRDDHTCEACYAARLQRIQVQRSLEEAQKKQATENEHNLREVKLESGKIAYEHGLHLSLQQIELRTLVELAVLPPGVDFSEAYKVIGISNKRGDQILQKLVAKDLICCCKCHGWKFPQGADVALASLKQSVRLKPIMNVMEQEIFRRLKTRHSILFPHQLLRTFIPEHVAREVLANFKDISFGSYLCMEVDFLICDDEYRPVRAVEYQGGYHQASEQQVRDRFKANVCEAAGVPLTQFEKSSLWKSEELVEAVSS